MAEARIINMPKSMQHTRPLANTSVVNHPAQEEAMKTILGDPIVVAKMKDFIKKNTSWTPSDDSIILAGQVELAREVLGDQFDAAAKESYPSESQYNAFKKSHQYPSQRRYGIKQLEKKNGFKGFDDEDTAHFTPLAVSTGLIDPYASFDDDDYAHFLPLDILKGGVKLVKGAVTKIKDKKAANKANAATVAGLQNQTATTPVVNTAIQKVGKKVAGAIKEKKAAADQILQNQLASATLAAKNSAIAAGAPADIVNNVTDPAALSALATTYNAKNGGNVVTAPVTALTPVTPVVTPDLNPLPTQAGMSPLMIGGLLFLFLGVIYFATK